MWALNMAKVRPLMPADICSFAFFHPFMCSSVVTGGGSGWGALGSWRYCNSSCAYGSVYTGGSKVPSRTCVVAGSSHRYPKCVVRGICRNGVSSDAWIFSSLTWRSSDSNSFLSVHSRPSMMIFVTLAEESLPVTCLTRHPNRRCSSTLLMRSRSLGENVSRNFSRCCLCSFFAFR